MLILTILQGPDKGRRFELPDDEPQLIGRSSEALQLADQTISRRHAELTPDDGQWYIRDLRSANGTFVNGKRVTERTLLRRGDQVRTGNTLFVFGRDAMLAEKRRRGVRVAKKDEIDAHVEHTVPSSEDSMIMAVPEPNEAAATQLKVIYGLTKLIGSTVNQQELLERVMDVIFEHFQPDRGFILLQTDPEERPDPVIVRHKVHPTNSAQAQITVSRTIVQHVLHNGEGVLSSNAMTDKRFTGGDSVQKYAIRSAMCVPIRFQDRIFGVLHIDSQIANYTYTEDQLLLLTAIGLQTGLALANQELYSEQLQSERLAAVGETVASLSHSIKNIIQGLRGGADVVELGMRKSNMNVVRNGWQIVARNLDRIYNLTLNMLTYSKQRRPELEMVNLEKLLQESAALVQAQFDKKKVALIPDFDTTMPPVPLDSGGLHQALLNLLNNALEAVQSETGAVTLGCDYDANTQTVRIRVSDNGVGISDEQRKHLFEPFHSTKGMQGTGLGLVVTKKVVEEHGGTITVESSPNQGTVFTLVLPTSMDRIPGSADTLQPAPGDIKADSAIKTVF